MNFFYFIFTVSSFYCLIACCKNQNTIENKFTPLDFKLKLEALNYRDYVIQKFNDTIPNKKYDYYYLIYYNAFNEGNSIQFVKKGNRYFLTEKVRYPKEGSPLFSHYSMELNEEDWERVENMVNDFDFWTEKQFKHNRVLDGYHYYLEVNKSLGNEKKHRIVGRFSPRYDKIGALCEYIIQFKEVLFYNHEANKKLGGYNF